MGEAKRRRELGLPPKRKKEGNSKINKINSWSEFSIKKLKSQYPAAPLVTTVLIFTVLQWNFTLNG